MEERELEHRVFRRVILMGTSWDSYLVPSCALTQDILEGNQRPLKPYYDPILKSA